MAQSKDSTPKNTLSKILAIDPRPSIKQGPVAGVRWWDTRKALDKKPDLIQARAMRKMG
jgi:hypothetical protein